MSVKLALQEGDVTQVESDVLILKYARSFHGADAAVSAKLADRGVCAYPQMRPNLWESTVIETGGVVASSRVMFIGTPALAEFRYPGMERFAREAIKALHHTGFHGATLTTTIHGAGYGLDAEESLQAMVAGFQRGLSESPLEGLQQITFVEVNHRRATILAKALGELPSSIIVTPRTAPSQPTPPSAPSTPEKKRVFVAMPFSDDFDDVYQFGIYDVVRRCGYVCERVDETALAGSIIDQIQEGIRNAAFVVADLTGERPNVYLEVGYAWGINRRVLLVARDGTKLHFDLSHHKCIFYKSIGRMGEELEATIRRLSAAGSF